MIARLAMALSCALLASAAVGLLFGIGAALGSLAA